jgi:hypothetical protein
LYTLPMPPSPTTLTILYLSIILSAIASPHVKKNYA